MMEVLILAAGKGSRLRPLSFERPKALCTVCNIPILGYLLDQLLKAGIKEATLALSVIGDETQKLVSAATPPGFELKVFEVNRLSEGSVVTTRQIKPKASSLLIIYGDSFLSTDFSQILNFHQQVRGEGGMATLLYHQPKDLRVAEKDGRTYHGILSLDASQRVTAFVEKPRVEEIRPGFDMASAAVFICEADLLSHPYFNSAKDFSYDIFEPIIRHNIAPIYGCSIEAGFRYDLGHISRLYDANIKALRREMIIDIRATEIRPGVWVGENTYIDQTKIEPPVLLGSGITISNSASIGPDLIIGDRCNIDSYSTVRHAVIMEDCNIGSNAVLDHCIIGPKSNISSNQSLNKFSVIGAYSTIGSDGWP